MTQSLLTLHLFLALSLHSVAQLKTDSARPYTLVISPRVNSAGYFPFTGAVLNHHVNFDFTVDFEKANRGFVLFQSLDLQNKNSPINYFQPCVFEKFLVDASLSFGVYFGYLFSASWSCTVVRNSLPGSDGVTLLAFLLQPSEMITKPIRM